MDNSVNHIGERKCQQLLTCRDSMNGSWTFSSVFKYTPTNFSHIVVYIDQDRVHWIQKIEKNTKPGVFRILTWFRLLKTFGVKVSLVAQMAKNLPAVQEIWVQSLGREDPWRREYIILQYSCLDDSMDRGAWWAKSWTWTGY